MPGPVNFKDKISRQRPYGRSEAGLRASDGNLQAVVDQLESDRGRIMHSAAVRRLQQKTQVFPLERNAAVRSRLTHSLEVQQTGRFIVRTLYKQLGDKACDYGLDGLEGALDRALLEDASLPNAIVQTFKDVAMDRVFCYREVETLQLQGYRILQGLLDAYAPLLRTSPATFHELTEGRCRREPHLQMLARRLPSQLVKAYHEALKGIPDGSPEQSLWEFYYRSRMIQDFVSGMTDQHAQDEYRTLLAS